MPPTLPLLRLVGCPRFGSVCCALTLVAGAWSFLPSQVIWGDEGTQLVGLALGPVQVTRWLAGVDRHDYGQFPDRMPPFSYWAGWAWGRIFGFGEASLRWFGVGCVAAATALVFRTARTALGTPAGWGAGLLFATAPGIVMIAVEIRAYPLFLLASAASFHALIRLIDGAASVPGAGGRWVWNSVLSLSLSIAVVTHFFGVVLAAGILSTLAAHSWGSRRRVVGLAAVSAVVGLSVVAIVPFILASVGMTRRASRPPGIARIEAVYKLLLELNDHPALMVAPAVEACFFAGLVLLVLAAALANSRGARAPMLALTVGLGLVALAQLVIGRDGFQVCSANYNLWMKPGLCLVAAAGLASRGRAVRRVAGVAAAVVVAAQGVGVIQLACRGDQFAHCSQGGMASIIRGLRSADLAIVHDDPTRRFVFVANPARLEFGGALEQFRLLEASGGTAVVPLAGDPTPRDVAALPHRYLLLVRCAPTGDRRLVDLIRSGGRPVPPGPILSNGHAERGRRLILSDDRVTRISARIDVFERLAR